MTFWTIITGLMIIVAFEYCIITWRVISIDIIDVNSDRLMRNSLQAKIQSIIVHIWLNIIIAHMCVLS